MNGKIYTNRSAVPWWAAFGAPLVGVPILVGLLALGGAVGARPAQGAGGGEVGGIEGEVALPAHLGADADLSC